MIEYEAERLALINALGHAGKTYRLIGEAAAGGGPIASLVEPLARDRSRRAEQLAKIWNLALVGDQPTDAEADDIQRRSGGDAMSVLERVMDEERAIAEIIEDMPVDAIDRDVSASIAKSVGGSLEKLWDAMLRLREGYRSADSEPSLGFGLDSRPPVAEQRSGPTAHVYQVWFGTNREPVRKNGTITGFSAQQSEELHLGQCEVTIPKAHMIGSTGSAWWHRIGRGDDRLRLNKVHEQQPSDFWESVRSRLAASAEPGDAIVFIHGYRVSFEDAAIRAAQIGADLAIQGAMAFFSWPSQARLLRYTADEATIDASEAQITQFLTEFAQTSGARAVHVIAHSMGNRGLLRAVNRIVANAAGASNKPFGQIILAAADVDARLFRDLATAYPQVAERTTLYVSSGDWAVRFSRLLHAADRVGFTPPIPIVDGVDTVNVTGVDLTLLGHGYVGESRSVLQDMYELIVRGTMPERRAMLRRLLGQDDRPYWEIAA
ncbi:MAG: alpha/beta hydrolase [Pseudomonadota bacterium]